MNQNISDLLINLTSSRPGIAAITLLIAAIFPLTFNITIKVMTLFGLRVNILGIHPTTAYISSVLLNLMIILPLGVLLWCMYNLVPFDFLYDSIILIFCFDYSSLRHYAKEVSYQLRNGNNKEAKNALHPFVLREVDKLSSMGLAKATTESLPLNFLVGVYVPLFWYLLAGPTTAFFASILMMLNKAFNPKLPRNNYFGKLNYSLASIITFVPGIIMILMLQIVCPSSSIKLALTQKNYHPNKISAIIIALIGFNLGISLGGPRIYNGQKIRYAHIGGNTDPAPVHIDITYRRIRNSILLLALLILLVKTISLL